MRLRAVNLAGGRGQKLTLPVAAARSIIWLVVETNDDDYLLLQGACSHIQTQPKLHRVKDGVQAQCYLGGLGAFGCRDVFPLPSLILSELKLPRLHAFPLLTWTKTQPLLRSIPFVLLTRSHVPYNRLRALDLGADGYLVKPKSAGTLAQLLQSLLQSVD